jgi:carboxymethylenebutenolidase
MHPKVGGRSLRARETKIPVLESFQVNAYLAVPDAVAWKSAVVVLDDGPGIGENIRELCRALAQEGHAAVAPDLFTLRAGEAGLTSMWADGVEATLCFLRAESPRAPHRLGIIGFGVGGFVALLAGYRCQLSAAVSFYGEGVMRLRSDLGILDGPKPHAATLLCFVGADDDAIRAEDLGVVRERLTGSRVPHSFVVYPRTKGRFFFPGVPEHRPAAAEDAWRRLLHTLETAPRLRYRFRKK